MSVYSLPKSIATSATTTAARLIAVPGTTGVTNRASAGVAVKAAAANSDTVYVGGSDVSSSNGYPLAAGESVSIPAKDPSDVYVVAGSGTQDVRTLYL